MAAKHIHGERRTEQQRIMFRGKEKTETAEEGSMINFVKKTHHNYCIRLLNIQSLQMLFFHVSNETEP